ncbi:hypothetical protein FB451DRAFT_1563542 [Mycena latifolia]|nr:hypothetical protein FB451DRAFT_1563542 [Mycena latifolia]
MSDGILWTCLYLSTMFESTPTSPLNSPADSLAQLPDDVHTRTLRRRRTCSSLVSSSSKITLDLPTKADPSVYLTVRSGRHTAVGAFSPTADATASLQFFTSKAKSPPPSAWTTPRRSATAPACTTLSIPSISRTASSFGASDLAPSPTSPAAASLLDFDRNCAPKRTMSADSTPPALASLERRSRLCANRVFCATCRTPGTNFPACARCGSAWCSRACRLPGGKRHVCLPQATAAPAPVSRTGISSPPVPVPSAPARVSVPVDIATPAPIPIPSTPMPIPVLISR